MALVLLDGFEHFSNSATFAKNTDSGVSLGWDSYPLYNSNNGYPPYLRVATSMTGCNGQMMRLHYGANFTKSGFTDQITVGLHIIHSHYSESENPIRFKNSGGSTILGLKRISSGNWGIVYNGTDREITWLPYDSGSHFWEFQIDQTNGTVTVFLDGDSTPVITIAGEPPSSTIDRFAIHSARSASNSPTNYFDNVYARDDLVRHGPIRIEEWSNVSVESSVATTVTGGADELTVLSDSNVEDSTSYVTMTNGTGEIQLKGTIPSNCLGYIASATTFVGNASPFTAVLSEGEYLSSKNTFGNSQTLQTLGAGGSRFIAWARYNDLVNAGNQSDGNGEYRYFGIKLIGV